MTDSLHQKQDKTPDTQQQQLHLAIPHTTLHTTYTHTLTQSNLDISIQVVFTKKNIFSRESDETSTF